MKRYISLLCITVLLLAGGLISSLAWAEDPPPLLWSQTYDGGDWDEARGVAIDSSGNIIAVGPSSNGSGSNWLIRKYKADGTLLWSQTSDGEAAEDVAVDSSGNVIVAGGIWNATNSDWPERPGSR